MEFGGNVDEFVPSLMIRSLCHARPLPSHFTDDQPTCYSLMRSMGGVERCCAAKAASRLDANARRVRRLTDLGS